MLENLCYNVTANGMEESIEPCKWDWDLQEVPNTDLKDITVIVAADIVYEGAPPRDQYIPWLVCPCALAPMPNI